MTHASATRWLLRPGVLLVLGLAACPDRDAPREPVPSPAPANAGSAVAVVDPVVDTVVRGVPHGGQIVQVAVALDRELVELRADQNAPWVHATPVGDRHVVTQTTVDGAYRMQLVDLERPEQAMSLGTYRNVERVEYATDAGVLGIGLRGSVQRFALDLETNSVTRLAPLERTGWLTALRLLDPARADGLAAITVGWAHDSDASHTLTLHRGDGTRKLIRPFDTTVFGIDPDGTMYTYTANAIQVRRGAQQLASFPAEGVGAQVAVGARGTRFAMRDRNDVVMRDGKGAVLWCKPLWGTAQLVFTPDGERLAVRGIGGLVLLAADSGERIALECGWSFGLMTTPPTSNTVGAAPMCEDATL